MSTLIFILLAIIILFIIIFFAAGFKLVRQTENYVIERLGAYNRTLGVGIHFIVPFLDRVAEKVSLKEQIKDFKPQAVITKDNVTMQIDTVVFYQITDPKLYAYGIDNPISAIENLTSTTLRNIIGDLDLDETLTSRDLINTKIRIILDEATDPWGIKVNRVEVQNIMPPKDIRESMEKQMRAERERRQTILIAEGEKRAAILTAEGNYEAMILKAEAEKKKVVLEAEAEAEAIERLKSAEAKGIELIKNAKADDAVLTIKSYEALEKLANGKSTKIIIPTDITKLSSTILSAKEIITNEKKED